MQIMMVTLHPEEIASLLIPEFVHFYKPETRQNLYWGRNALKLNTEYFGIAVIFFAAMAIARVREDKRVLPLLILAAVALEDLQKAAGIQVVTDP